MVDFYIVSKNLEWIIGQNHDDVLFCYGEISNKIKNYCLKYFEESHK